mmetsp:Transcript_61336/g.122917  ORF Transcript_61336/g.122917 Transcript_61336/m.122917 type:complete len:203 (+) Transcript_61336:390-998(+)
MVVSLRKSCRAPCSSPALISLSMYTFHRSRRLAWEASSSSKTVRPRSTLPNPYSSVAMRATTNTCLCGLRLWSPRLNTSAAPLESPLRRRHLTYADHTCLDVLCFFAAAAYADSASAQASPSNCSPAVPAASVVVACAARAASSNMLATRRRIFFGWLCWHADTMALPRSSRVPNRCSKLTRATHTLNFSSSSRNPMVFKAR